MMLTVTATTTAKIPPPPLAPPPIPLVLLPTVPSYSFTPNTLNALLLLGYVNIVCYYHLKKAFRPNGIHRKLSWPCVQVNDSPPPHHPIYLSPTSPSVVSINYTHITIYRTPTSQSSLIIPRFSSDVIVMVSPYVQCCKRLYAMKKTTMIAYVIDLSLVQVSSLVFFAIPSLSHIIRSPNQLMIRCVIYVMGDIG